VTAARLQPIGPSAPDRSPLARHRPTCLYFVR
jgi:hypothetical protein